MSRAEISAYLSGTNQAARLIEQDFVAWDGWRLDEMPTTDEEVAALERLGGEKYAYWVLRGARDVLAERPT